jgi:predicted 3-demethylubiquinone-9 3-methyltransferase (glyoxalase superfamily)
MSLAKLNICPCLGFDGQAAEAAEYYVAIFPNSRVVSTTRYTEAGQEHGHQAGKVMVVSFELDRQPFVGLNGGPQFQFNEAISLQIHCDTQEQVDHYWERLSSGGRPEAQQCGWLKDRYGVSWQVVPRPVIRLLEDPDRERARRAMEALLQMKKIDIAAVEAAVAG